MLGKAGGLSSSLQACREAKKLPEEAEPWARTRPLWQHWQPPCHLLGAKSNSGVNNQVLFQGPVGMLLAHCMDEIMEALQMEERDRNRERLRPSLPGESQGLLGPGSSFFCIEFYP